MSVELEHMGYFITELKERRYVFRCSACGLLHVSATPKGPS